MRVECLCDESRERGLARVRAYGGDRTSEGRIPSLAHGVQQHVCRFISIVAAGPVDAATRHYPTLRVPPWQLESPR